MSTSKRPKWVKPGQQWYAGQTQEQFEKAGGILASGFSSGQSKEIPPIQPTSADAKKELEQQLDTSLKGKEYSKTQGITIPTGEAARGKQVRIKGTLYPSQEWYDVKVLGKKEAVAGSNVSDYSGVSSLADANEVINANQEKDAESATIDIEPETRKTTEEIMEEIQTAIKPTTKKPEAADFMGAITGYRSEYGVNALETQLDDLRAQEQDLLAIKQTRINAERGKTVATNVIEGRVSEVERQENERIGVVQRSIANATNQLNTKYNIINTLMKAKEMDYNSAVDAYDKEMSTNISMYNAARNIEEADKTEIEREKDNARSNAQIAINALTASGMTYDQLSSSEQTNLIKLGVQSGLGADFFANVLKVSSGKDILTTVVSADDTKATIIYKDGTTKVFPTGLPARVVAGEEPTSDEIKVTYKQFAETELKKVVGEDGKVSPQDWAKARKVWTSNTPYKAADFDDAFRGYIDPSHPQDYAGFENYDPNFIKKSTSETAEILNLLKNQQ